MAEVYAGFQKKLEVYGTGDLGRVVVAMNAKALVAGRVLLRSPTRCSKLRLRGSA